MICEYIKFLQIYDRYDFRSFDLGYKARTAVICSSRHHTVDETVLYQAVSGVQKFGDCTLFQISVTSLP